MKKFLPLVLSVSLYAGIYTNNLVNCMINHTTPNDVKMLKKWIFFAFAQDKDLSKYAKITPKEKEEAQRQMGRYVTRLLAEDCKKELKKAVELEGTKSIPIAFEYLGRMAAGSLAQSPQAREFLQGFIKYTDMKKIDSIIKQK